MEENAAEVRLNAFFDSLKASLEAQTHVFGPARERQIERMRKRARLSGEDLEGKAVFELLKNNFALRGFRHRLGNDVLIEARFFIRRLLENYITSRLDYHIQQPLDKSLLFDRWRFGPGSSYGVLGTHTAMKIEQPMTTTRENEPYVRRLRAANSYMRAIDSVSVDRGIRLVCGSKLSTVPKNEDNERTIASEPSGNMALQLAAGLMLQEALEMIGLDIRKQEPLNKALAKRGSIDGSLATIDLKMASDRVTPDLVRALFPDVWYDLLMEIRSPSCDIHNEWIDLNMISTMGNGYTFPLMTMIITALVYANRRVRGGRSQFIDWRSTAVYGDDIIVPTQEYESLTIVLQEAGFIVNSDKSFSTGPFRESCGGDYWSGCDITPFYVKNLRSDSEIYVAINQLTRWSAANGFWPTAQLRLLYSYLRHGPYFVPFWEAPTSGVLTTRVARKYKRLEPIQKRVPYKGRFAMMLACGGYITGSGSGPFYVPRPDRKNRLRYRTRDARLPKGYLDGGVGSHELTQAMQSRIDLILDLV